MTPPTTPSKMSMSRPVTIGRHGFTKSPTPTISMINSLYSGLTTSISLIIMKGILDSD